MTWDGKAFRRLAAVVTIFAVVPLAPAGASANGGGLVVCAGATSDPALSGVTFQYTVKKNQKAVASFGLLPGSCSTPVSGSTGIGTATTYVVREHLGAGGSSISAITAAPTSALNKGNLDTGKANMTVQPGATTTVTFANATAPPVPPAGDPGPQPAFVLVCVDGRNDLAGSVNFNLDDHQGHVYSGQDAVVVPVDTCQPVGVTSGTVDVAELGPQPSSQLLSIYSVPDGALVPGSVQIDSTGQQGIAGSAQVVVSPSTSALHATEIHFVVQRLALGVGTIEICKNVLFPKTYNGTPFFFTVDGDIDPQTGDLKQFQVAAGACSFPLLVPLGRDGTVTVTELPNPAFGVVSVTASAAGDPVPVTGTNPVTFKVVPTASETEVTFTNAVRTAFIKVCKLIEPGSEASLAGQMFTFDVYVNGAQSPTFTATIAANTCSGLLGPVPVVTDVNGTPATVTVAEETNAGDNFAVASMSVDNVFPGTHNPSPVTSNGITFNPGPGTDVVMTVNRYSKPAT